MRGQVSGRTLANLRLTTDGSYHILDEIPGDSQSGVSSFQATRTLSAKQIESGGVIGRPLALGSMSSASCPVLGPKSVVGGCMGLEKCTIMSAVVGNPSLTKRDPNCGHQKRDTPGGLVNRWRCVVAVDATVLAPPGGLTGRDQPTLKEHKAPAAARCGLSVARFPSHVSQCLRHC